MARKRVIDTGLYFDTEIVRLLGPRGLHLYIRLWGLAEDWGGYEANYEDIALQMGALKFTAKEAKKFIECLIGAGKIIPYKNGNGRDYHWLKNFPKYQPLSSPGLSKIPLPEWIHEDRRQYPNGKRYATYSVITGSLPVAYQQPTGNGEIEIEIEIEKKRNRKEIEIGGNYRKPTLEEVSAYCQERRNGVSPQKWIDHYISNGWKIGKNPMKDWKAAIRTWEKENDPSQKSKVPGTIKGVQMWLERKENENRGSKGVCPTDGPIGNGLPDRKG